MIYPSMRFFDTETLISLNEKAIELKLNRALEPEVYDRLDPTGLHLVTQVVYQERGICRSILMMKFEGQDEPVTHHTLDMEWEDYEGLMKYTKDIAKLMGSVKLCGSCGRERPHAQDDYLCVDCRLKA